MAKETKMQDNMKIVESEPAIIVGVQTPDITDDEFSASLDELERLLETAGGRVAARLEQRKENPSPRTYIGSGKVAELATLCRKNGIRLVVFDCELSPSQIKNLEDALSVGEEVTNPEELLPGEPIFTGDIGAPEDRYMPPPAEPGPVARPAAGKKVKSEPFEVRVIDRSMLILDIFALHAVTSEGKLQVELAQLQYTVPRLTGKGIELSRQQGGNIAMRGPGETKLETDRRHVRRRMRVLREELERIEASRAVLRQRRERAGIPRAAIAGYTNAGKSTLLNTLTGAGILAEDKLFATLDPTTRQYELPSGAKMLLTDTVGFIRNLPHHLIEAFKSTLEEVRLADFLVVLIDASDPEREKQLEVTRKLLAELGAANKPTLYVYNKCDLPAECLGAAGPSSALLSDRTVPPENVLFVSALTGQGIDTLIAALERLVAETRRELWYFFPHAEQGALSRLYQLASVGEPEYREDGVAVSAVVDEKTRGMFRQWEVAGEPSVEIDSQ
ncbi:MAG: GTPase HflX [Eubacteriales bacterium]